MAICPSCLSLETKRFGSNLSSRFVLVDMRLTKEPIERQRYRCKRCQHAFQDPPSPDEVETHEIVARKAMRCGLAATASAFGSENKLVGRILTNWSATQAEERADGCPLPDTVALKTLSTSGRDRLLVVDGEALEVVDLLADHGELAGWCAARGGTPEAVMIEVDAALRHRVAALFPSAVIVVAPAVSALNVEKAALRELKAIIRAARAEGRNQSIDPRLLRRRAAALGGPDRAEMEWWPESAKRLWRAKESLLDALSAPRGSDRDLLIASARVDMRAGAANAPLAALVDAWLDAMLAGADLPWTVEAHLRTEGLLATARRCKPNAGYAVLRAIIMFEGGDGGMVLALTLAPSGAPFSPPRSSGRRIEDAVESLRAMAEDGVDARAS